MALLRSLHPSRIYELAGRLFPHNRRAESPSRWRQRLRRILARIKSLDCPKGNVRAPALEPFLRTETFRSGRCLDHTIDAQESAAGRARGTQLPAICRVPPMLFGTLTSWRQSNPRPADAFRNYRSRPV